MRRPMAARALGAVGFVAVTGLTACGSGGAEDVGQQPVERVLVVSLPGVSWDEVRGNDLPNLEAFTRDAAIGDLSTRIGRRNAGPTDGYLSLGAGTRAVSPVIDRAVALDPDESYGGVPAAEILEGRLGSVPEGIFYLAIGSAIDVNDNSAFGAEVGTLGDALDEAGVGRAVIANADAAEGFVSNEPPPDGAFVRSAATMLMGSDGIVPEGTVGRDLLMEDPDAAFGRRLDPDAVLAHFDQVWSRDERSVVLVEGSDLLRAASYRPRATTSQGRALYQDALADSDELLGQLLERVDPETDAVVVLSPVAPGSAPALGIVGLRAPGVDSGYLQSATTRRAGYVQLGDVAPTVLSLLGEEAPDEVEGRDFQVVDRGARARVVTLADAADAAEFRDGIMATAVTVVIALIGLVVLGTTRRDRLPPRVRGLLVPAAFSILGVVPASFVVALVDAVRGNTLAYLLAVLALALVVGAVATLVERRRPGWGGLLAVGTTVALIATDLLVGAPLQLNTVFGYSVGVAGRFVGLGNLAFALFGSATIVLAVMTAQSSSRWGRPLALGLLAVVVLVEGLPMLGADVGGVLSMVPAFGVTALVLVGRRVGLREVCGLAVATGLVLFAFAFIDAARAPSSQTHLARLAEQLVDGRWEPFFGSLSRRWQASFGGAELAGWITVAGVVLATAAYVVLVARGRLGPGRTLGWDRPTTAAASGLGVLAVVGLVANDSSFAVPATMLIVAVPVLVLRQLGAVAPAGTDA